MFLLNVPWNEAGIAGGLFGAAGLLAGVAVTRWLLPSLLPATPPPLASPAAAQDKRANIAPADIEAATYSGTGELPSGQSALTAKLQVLLDRSGVSPGVVDGFRGGMSESAIKAFERKNGLPQDGRLDAQVWALLEQHAVGPLTSTYTVTAEDAQGLVDSIPADYAEKDKMSSMGYTSVTEKLAELFETEPAGPSRAQGRTRGRRRIAA